MSAPGNVGTGGRVIGPSGPEPSGSTTGRRRGGFRRRRGTRRRRGGAGRRRRTRGVRRAGRGRCRSCRGGRSRRSLWAVARWCAAPTCSSGRARSPAARPLARAPRGRAVGSKLWYTQNSAMNATRSTAVETRTRPPSLTFSHEVISGPPAGPAFRPPRRPLSPGCTMASTIGAEPSAVATRSRRGAAHGLRAHESGGPPRTACLASVRATIRRLTVSSSMLSTPIS